ncbi:MAG: hypothetical protein A2Y24_01555 [Clostridiales bacterium GWE2_32_10]|nr:MAG: hypothetical protein A2Y24_01555 [Clostridiales bacterium GWE2_32_10]HBY21436.1 hypothetical protein [Clostridiales bacterium]
MNVIGVQFLRNSVSVAYYNKKKLLGKTIEVENVIGDSDYVIYLNKIFEEMKLLKGGKYKVVISLPTDLVETFTLKQLVPITKKFMDKNKKHELIIGQIESVLEKSTHEYIIEYDIVSEQQLYNNKMLTTILNIKIDNCTKYINKITTFKNMMIIAVDTEYEALRRLIPIEIKEVVIINFFKDDNEMVGIYIYIGSKLIGLRYLHKRLYDSDSIVSEVERMIVYCKTFYRELNINNWFVFGKKIEIEELLKNENVIQHEISTCSFAVSAGLAIKEDYEKRKVINRKGGASKNAI